MTQKFSQPASVNVMLANANWAWPQAVAQIFQPRGINALVADSTADMVRLVAHNKIHLAILDQTSGGENTSGMHTLKIIRNHDRLLPCILLAHNIDKHLLSEALALKAFSVVAKPVNLKLLAEQIHRLFLKYYSFDMFST